jgi:ketosteroid isomerase-like protein
MSTPNAEIVRRIHEAWSRGQRAPKELMDPEVEYVNPPEAVEPGTRRGFSQFAAAVNAPGEMFDEITIEPESYFDAGESIVVIGVLRGRGRGSRLLVERRQGYIWTLRDGRAIRFAWFNEPRDALESVGLDPELTGSS